MIPTFQQGQFGRRVTAAALQDPYSATNVLLLHGEGSDGSTTFVDSSPINNTMNAQGSAQIDTAEFKWGSSSILLNGTSDYVKAATASNFHNVFTGDFSIEAWINPSAIAGKSRYIFSATDNLIAGFCQLYLGLSSSGHLVGYVGASTGGGEPEELIISSSGLVTTGSWQFVGIYRQGTTCHLRHQGTQVASTSAWVNFGNALVNHVAVGAIANGYTDGSTGRFAGWIDDLRVSKHYRNGGADGVPTEQFPDA